MDILPKAMREEDRIKLVYLDGIFSCPNLKKLIKVEHIFKVGIKGDVVGIMLQILRTVLVLCYKFYSAIASNNTIQG